MSRMISRSSLMRSEASGCFSRWLSTTKPFLAYWTRMPVRPAPEDCRLCRRDPITDRDHHIEAVEGHWAVCICNLRFPQIAFFIQFILFNYIIDMARNSGDISPEKLADLGLGHPKGCALKFNVEAKTLFRRIDQKAVPGFFILNETDRTCFFCQDKPAYCSRPREQYSNICLCKNLVAGSPTNKKPALQRASKLIAR